MSNLSQKEPFYKKVILWSNAKSSHSETYNFIRLSFDTESGMNIEENV